MGQIPPLAKVAAITAIVSQFASMEQHFTTNMLFKYLLNIIFLVFSVTSYNERQTKRIYLEIEIQDFF